MLCALRISLCSVCLFLAAALPVTATAAAVNATWNTAADVPVTAASYTATGSTLNLTLNFAPATGANLMVVNNTGLPFIDGTFDNLAQGQAVALTYNGVIYKFVARYYGGTGNDLVLVWASNRIMGWGAGSFGQIGDGDYTARHTVMVPAIATGVLAGRTVTALAQGNYHSLALLSNGTAASWGRNSEGQLGGNDFSGATGPMLVSTDSGISALHGKTVVAVSAGGVHSLALCSDGSVVAWGSNSNGQLGNGVGVGIGYSVPVAVNTTNGVSALYGKTVVAISAGSSHSLALCSDGTVVAWGWNHDGQLGNNSTTDSSVPVAVNTTSGVSALYGQTVVAIASGSTHSLALRSDGTVVAWGYNGSGQLGDNTLTSRSVPVATNTTSGISALYGTAVVALAAGENHTVALCADGSVAAWGSNYFGQVGDDTTTMRQVPTAVKRYYALSGKTVTAIAAAENNSRAVCSDGTVATWGSNYYGNLGNGGTSDGKVPVAVETTPLGAGERMVTPASSANTALSLVLATSPPPTVTTLAATAVGGAYATVNGTVNANNGFAVAVSFDYGTTAAYGSNVTATPASATGGSDTAVSAALTGLMPDTTYHFRVNGSGYSGSDQTFTTLKNNANLASLTTTAGSLTPAFDSGITRYTVAVAAGTSSVTVTPSVSDSTATLKVNGVSLTSGSESSPASLGYGDNAINVLVTAQDGVTQ